MRTITRSRHSRQTTTRRAIIRGATESELRKERRSKEARKCGLVAASRALAG
jgi:hypothetical protein